MSVVSFSSRGPVTVDGSGRIKPDIVAPGTNTRSSVNSSDTAYTNFSGTSMAGPHVVGVVALLWPAEPGLVRNIAPSAAPVDDRQSGRLGFQRHAVRQDRPCAEQPLRLRTRRCDRRCQRQATATATASAATTSAATTTTCSATSATTTRSATATASTWPATTTSACTATTTSATTSGGAAACRA